MATTLDLPEDLIEEIRRRASREGRKLDDTGSSARRRALGAAAFAAAFRTHLLTPRKSAGPHL